MKRCIFVLEIILVLAFGGVAQAYATEEDATGSSQLCEVRVDENGNERTSPYHEYSEWTVVKGNKIIPPIVKEKECIYCHYKEQINDWGYAWIAAIGVVVLFGVICGVASSVKNYAVGMKGSKNEEEAE